jgi:hypothetical protein
VSGGSFVHSDHSMLIVSALRTSAPLSIDLPRQSDY